MKLTGLLIALILSTNIYAQNLKKSNYSMATEAVLHQIVELSTKLTTVKKDSDKKKINKAIDFYKDMLGKVLMRETVKKDRYFNDCIDKYKSYVIKTYLPDPIHKEKAKSVIIQLNDILPKNYKSR